MTALDDAARAVEEAREAVHEWLYPLTAARTAEARAAVARLENAVRRHDAEVVRADTGHIRYGSATEYAIRHAALIDPDSPMCTTKPESASEVEVRFTGGPTVRIARFTVTTEAATGLVAVEGFITSSTGQPRSGDAVRLAYLGIPGRGALADITASVALFTRLDVLNIRIRTTIRPEETP